MSIRIVMGSGEVLADENKTPSGTVLSVGSPEWVGVIRRVRR